MLCLRADDGLLVDCYVLGFGLRRLVWADIDQLRMVSWFSLSCGVDIIYFVAVEVALGLVVLVMWLGGVWCCLWCGLMVGCFVGGLLCFGFCLEWLGWLAAGPFRVVSWVLGSCGVGVIYFVAVEVALGLVLVGWLVGVLVLLCGVVWWMELFCCANCCVWILV